MHRAGPLCIWDPAIHSLTDRSSLNHGAIIHTCMYALLNHGAITGPSSTRVWMHACIQISWSYSYSDKQKKFNEIERWGKLMVKGYYRENSNGLFD